MAKIPAVVYYAVTAVAAVAAAAMSHESSRKQASMQADAAKAEAEREKERVQAAVEAEERKQEAIRREIEIDREQRAFEVGILEKQKGIEQEQFDFENALLQENINKLVATQTAGLAAAGIDVRTGSPLADIVATKKQGERETDFLRRGRDIKIEQLEAQQERMTTATDVSIERLNRDFVESQKGVQQIKEEGAHTIASLSRDASLYLQKASAAKKMGALKSGTSLLSGYSTYRTDRKTGSGFFA